MQRNDITRRMLQRDVPYRGKEGTYPGTRASATMIGDDETNWGTKSLAILDMPFTAVMDTLFTAVGCVPQRQLGALAR